MQGSLSSGLDIWNNVFHGQLDAAPSHTELQALADSTLAAWTNDLLGAGISGHFGNPTTVDKCTVTLLDNAGHALDIAEGVPAGASPHGSGGNPLPSEVAVCVSLVTALPGRRHRGRTFLAGVASNDSAADGLLAAGAPLIFANALHAFLLDAATDFHVVEPARTIVFGVLSTVGGYITPIVSTRVGNQFDVQRRRRNGTPEVYTPST